MEENPPRISCKQGTHNDKSSSSKKRSCSGRYTKTTVVTGTTNGGDEEEGGDVIECSSKYCGSCTAGLIADCVALCCCPCGVINIVAFAFVKVPWMCLKRVKMGRRNKRKKEKKSKKAMLTEDGDGNLGIMGIMENSFVIGEELGNGFEAERVWLELYKDGHFGFGRVSFTGIQ